LPYFNKTVSFAVMENARRKSVVCFCCEIQVIWLSESNIMSWNMSAFSF